MTRRARTPVGQGVLTFDVRRRLKRAGIRERPAKPRRSGAPNLLALILEDGGPGGLALMDRVLKKSGMRVDEFHREIERLEREGAIGLHFHDHPREMSDSLRAASLKRNGYFFHAVHLREPPAPAPPATAERLRVLIVPASDRPGIEGEGFYVVSPVGRFYRSTIEMARLTAELQAAAHGTTVDERI